jgi:drug/metabolite transporter (DMT)-like permease
MKPQLLSVIFLIFLTSLCDTISQLFLKSSVNSLNFDIRRPRMIFGFILKLLRTPRVWLGFVFSTLSLLIWLFVLTKAELNFAFSVDSMHYVLIAIASRLVLKERVSSGRWIGIILIMFGIMLVSAS